MKIKTQLTLAALMVMGMFATGCSQQSADASASPAQQTTGSQQTSQQATQESGATETTGTETTTTEVTETVQPQVKTVIKYDCSKCWSRPSVRPAQPRPVRPHARPSVRPVQPRPYVCPSVRPVQPRPVRPYVRPVQPRPYVRPVQPRPMPVVPEVVVPAVKAKGNYKGPVVLTPATREAIMQMQAE